MPQYDKDTELEMLGRAAFEAVKAAGADVDGADTWQEYFRPFVDAGESGLDFWANIVVKEIKELEDILSQEIQELEDRLDILEKE